VHFLFTKHTLAFRNINISKIRNYIFRKRTRGIGLKISLSVAILLVLALSITGFTSYIQSSNAMNSTIRTDLTNRASDNALLMNERINKYEISITDTAAKSTLSSGVLNQQLGQLAVDSITDGFSYMGVSDMSGNVTYTNSVTENISNMPYFKQLVKGAATTVISNPYNDKTLDEFVIMVATKVVYANGKTGIVLGSLDGKTWCSTIADIKVAGTGYAFIIDGDGVMTANNDWDKVTGAFNILNDAKKKNATDLTNIINKMISGKSGDGNYTYNGIKNEIFYAPIKDWGMYLAITVPQSELSAAVDAIGFQIFLFTLLFILIGILVTLVLSSQLVTRPLRKTVHMIGELSSGHLDERLDTRKKDEIGIMSRAMNSLADTLQNEIVAGMKNISEGNIKIQSQMKDERDEVTPALVNTVNTLKSITDEIKTIITAAESGDLSRRCDSELYSGIWSDITGEINKLIDCVARPINEVCGSIKKISAFDFTSKIENNYEGLFKELSDSTNFLSSQLLNLQQALKMVSAGDTSIMSSYEEIGRLSANDLMTPTIIRMMRNITNLINESKFLSDKAISGNVFYARSDSDKFEGGYKDIIDGFNSTLDAISKPVLEIVSAMEAMALNDFDVQVSDNYLGDYKVMADSVSQVQLSLKDVQHELLNVSQGDINGLEAIKSKGPKSENDQLTPTLIQMMNNIRMLIDETKYIASAGSAGNLSIRGDTTKFEGEYVNIISSINQFLTDVETPSNEITRVMLSMANADFNVSVEGNYQGEFALLVGAANKLAEVIKNIISDISYVLTEISSGNLQIDKVKDYPGDTASISSSINTILDSLNELLGNINMTADQVALGSTQIASGNHILSEGASTQAVTVEELSVSISEIASQTKENAENANKTDASVDHVRVNATSGKKFMDELLSSINVIGDSSKNISSIVKVINDIAFQTKMLALNASIEAARAGQQGSGFAVVANEVRNLAAKSSDAAKQISDLIEDMVNKIAIGEQTAAQTGKAFESIVAGVEAASVTMKQITESSNEQADEIAEMDIGLKQVTQVIQTTSATAEQSAASSEELSSQAEMLRTMVGRFKLKP
jgi:methyl-accepting chemotaxis protein